MKILVTGTNNYHARPNWHLEKRSRYRLVTATTGLVEALKDMGHDVDQRFVTPGEDLSGYDKVFTVYFDATGGMQPGGYGVYWLLANRPDAIVVIDDWQTPERLMKGFKKSATRTREQFEEVLFREFMLNDQHKEATDAITADPSLKEDIVRGYAKNVFDSHRILYCAFDKFEVSKIFDYPHESYSFCPESYVPSPDDRLREMGLARQDIFRERKWIIAGIGGLPTKKACKFKDNFTWDVEVFGRATIDVDAKLAKEPEVIQAYSGARAVFYPDQGNFGSNWWRNRPRQCADMGAVLFMMSEEEASLFGPSYMGLTLEGLEAMSDEELDDLAARQKADYYKSNPLDKEKVKAQLAQVMA